MSRSAIVVLLFAVSCMGNRAAEPIVNMTVTVGKNVMLPCPCSEDTNTLVWQIGEKIVVNHCCEEKHPLNESYINRTKVFLSLTKGNCSLLLSDVSLNDDEIFTCYIFDENKSMNMHNVRLQVEEITDVNPTPYSFIGDPSTTHNPIEPQRGVSFGVPISLILVILAGLIVAIFIRKHWQRSPRMVVIQDPQTKLPIMNHTPV